MLTADELDAIRGAAANGFVMSQAIISHIDAQAARITELEQDAARLDSGCIRTLERDDFGEEHYCIRNGINLRAAIDAAMSTQAATERP
ncbi:hypothetical protein HA052_15905 [Chromobacterium haemolyticum]|uniref:Uncharacterized protein n=1 Tax=Chromobacterium fluminis TaxID=3044269 RepID=A0ABX0LBQ1_9NEIS|nr:hypothetical protein [Chromobacterium haemolyticum]NHR06673.1 hypothetical protein [Chromobacterium haemolyticum]